MDLEKFHRVIGYYEGQKIKPLAIHERHITDNLEKNFRAPDQYIKRLQFDLFLKHVVCDERNIFETDKPEITLLYLLFSEGIKSLVLLRDLTGPEIKDWCVLVRETLVALDAGASKDLASVLWKTPFRNLRARIYNTLMDLADQRKIDAETPNAHGATEILQTMVESSSWHNRDSEWDLPSAENILRDREAFATMNSDELQSLRKHLSHTITESEENELLRMSDREIQLLSAEMASYDQSQVEFNLLAWDTSTLEASFGCDPDALKFIEDSVAALTESFVGRFHPGLIIHLMDEMEKFRTSSHAALRKRLEDAIGKSLNTEETHKRLLEALKDETRKNLAARLLPFLKREQLPKIVDHFLEAKDEEGLVIFLETIFKRDLPIEEILLSWGDERLCKILPLFRQLSWAHKIEFLLKSLRSRSPQIVKEASHYLKILPIKADHALDIYRKLPEDTQEVWMKIFKRPEILGQWRPFIEALARSNYWIETSPSLQMSWIEIFFKYLGENAFVILHRWVSARNYFFWPKFPSLREAILTVAMDLRADALNKHLNIWIKHESKVRFQDASLKDRLQRRAQQL